MTETEGERLSLMAELQLAIEDGEALALEEGAAGKATTARRTAIDRCKRQLRDLQAEAE